MQVAELKLNFNPMSCTAKIPKKTGQTAAKTQEVT